MSNTVSCIYWMFLDTAALLQLQVYAITQIQNNLSLVCLFLCFFFQVDKLNAASSLSGYNGYIQTFFSHFYRCRWSESIPKCLDLHISLSLHIWACTCQYCQHHASFLVHHCLWLEELNSQTEADSTIWQNFWKLLI